MSSTNCSAPNDENATSNESSANGRSVAVPQTTGTEQPVSASMRRECCSCRNARSRPDRGRAAGGEPARALGGAAADLEDVLAGDVAEHRDVALVDALGPPDEPDVAQERAVRGLVLVGVGVPVAAVGPPALGLGDRTADRVHALGHAAHQASIAVRLRPGSRLASSPSGPTARFRASTEACSSGTSCASSPSRGWMRSRVAPSATSWSSVPPSAMSFSTKPSSVEQPVEQARARPAAGRARRPGG